MYLLIFIPVICFINSLSHIIIRPIQAFLLRTSNEERQLLLEIRQLKTEQSKYSMRTEYTSYVKVERKILAVQTILEELRGKKQGTNTLVKFGLSYGSKAVITLSLIIISFTYRTTPVIVFDEKFDFTPFNGLIRFPTGIDGAISVPFWVFVSTLVSNKVASIF